jgi:hypothetical protein
VLHVMLALPHGSDAGKDARYPAALVDPANGLLALHRF